jgi:thiol-disulfide isomerase/thioredoxin
VRTLVAGQLDLAGRKLVAAKLKREIVLVSFFASWCPPCHKELRHLNELEDGFGPRGLSIFAINQFEHYAGVKGAEDRLDRFLGRYAPRFSVVKGGEAIGKAFENVQRIPTVFIFDQTGAKRFHFIHAQGATKMNPTIAELSAVLTGLFRSPQLQ